MVLNVLWLLLDVANVENLDLIKKLIFVQIVAIELQGLLSHLSEIRKVITERVQTFSGSVLNLKSSPKKVQASKDYTLDTNR